MSNLRAGMINVPTSARTLPSGIKDRLQNLMFVTKRVVAKILPSSLKNRLRLAMVLPKLTSNYVYDLKRFLKWSAVGGQANTQNQLRASITMDYHRLEKGLALKEPRVRFGPQVIERLLYNLRKYQENYGLDETAQAALNTLFAYFNFNLEHDLKDDQLHQALIALRDATPKYNSTTLQGGTIEVTKKRILEAAQLELQAFFEYRYSIRHFAPHEVDMSLIEKAVAMAQKTPSVCNRQSSKVYVFSSDEDKKKVLSYQNGNRGFGDQASKVLIVISDLEHFVSAGERNQCWIDGGMFSMSLVYALHSLGLGTCCLNWSVERQVDQELRRIAGIKDSEAVMMMIAVGHLPEKLKVAQSPRKKLNEVLVVK